MKIGELRCLFLKCYKKGRTPFMSVGPQWQFTIGLFVFAILAATYFIFMINVLKNLDYRFKVVHFLLIIINVFALILGVFQNPGVPQSVFDYKLKKQLGKNDQKTDNEEDEERQSLNQRDSSQIKRNTSRNAFCEPCNLQKDQTVYHCSDCDVCIKDLDHHCMFFSKCIGKGNVYMFYTSIILLFVVFTYFGVMVVVDAVYKK
ncbi:dhhc zinc finger domain containing protein [Stylonychia lemnae]|uniref:Palmitoyltransferase n=1 Tax=Stylonychia lemnae TaxID=5949 RepID=A0A078AFZ9_STYLE|nr:dhhc zinc finger domain containing protein [Stylonychia lemnae]|eukprot:CDW81230.1 dhhc zinc finger domain containing protein [Stylonychia lemnae]